ncbi:MAG TPA: hypothetical protein DC028_02155 [Eubacterium sp.]|jgi:hypothetical protein|nr:hypothetical protein [Eubacterium sp.]
MYYAERRKMAYNKNSRTYDDVIVKEFWRDNDRFADLFNAVLFKGKCVVKADELQEMDTDVSGTIKVKDYKETLKRARDVVKKYYNGIEFNILGLEMQEKVHLAMPLRTMVYDALGYIKEYNQIRQKNMESGYKGSDKEEFLSGLKYSDRFHPIITIVFYYGEKKWNGPTSLSDMMVDMPAEIKEMFNDYNINLIQAADQKTYNFNNDDVKALFDIIHSIYNKDFEYLAQKYANKSLPVDFIDMIGRITGTKNFIITSDDVRKGKVVKVEMWSAMKEFREGGRLEGKDQAMLENIKTLMRKLNQSEEEAMDTLDIGEEDRERYHKMLNA